MEKSKEHIKMNYETACYEYLKRLLKNWGYGDCVVSSVGWWVGDDIGGVFCLEDNTFLNMEDIRYCVDHDVDEDTYSEYLDYNLRCAEYGFNQMNLNAFVKGAPRVDDETFERLDNLSIQLQEEINKTKGALEKTRKDKV